MEKLRKVYIFLVLALCLSLFSCQGGDGGGSGDGGSQGSGNSQGGADTDSGTGDSGSADTAKNSYTIVYADGVPVTAVNKLVSQLEGELSADVSAMRYGSEVIPTENVIFVGECDTDSSRTANRRMLRLDVSDASVNMRYCVYVDGSNISLAFEKDSYSVNAALYTAAEEMVDKCFASGKIKEGRGVAASGVVNIIDYQRAIDTVEREAQFANVYQIILEKVDNDVNLADDIYEQIENLYGLYDNRMVSWMANLYDPDIGGFYFSNSARDTEGYLPDIETTRQMQGMITGLGLCTLDEMPQWLKDGMVKFVKSLQDPNGYFYHPQWTREMTDNNIQRRSRDLSFGCALLQSLGASPTYDTPSGIKGDGILADGTSIKGEVSGVTFRLGRDASSAVSSAIAKNTTKSTVIATASFSFNGSKDLASAEAFEAWLATLDINSSSWNSYYIGNSICTIAHEIVERDRQLKAEGKRGLIDIMHKWLDSKQNPKTGCWSPTLDIDATNGLFKILSFYGAIGRPLPHPIEGLESTMSILEVIRPEDVVRVCDIFNIWSNFEMIRDNVNTYGTAEQKKTVNEFYAGLIKISPLGLENSVKVLAPFVRDDGSMSYNYEGTCPTSQGMPVAVVGACEGDVNGCLMGSTGTTPGLMAILGLPSISIFTRADGIYFFSIIEQIGSVIKDEPKVYEEETFEYEAEGEGSSVVLKSTKASSGDGISIVDRGDGHGKVLRYASKGDGYDTMIFRPQGEAYSATCYVLDFDCIIETVDVGAVIQIQIDDAYFLNLSQSDGKIQIYTQTSHNSATWILDRLGSVADVGEWFNLRIEHYTGDASSVRTKVFVDEQLLMVSDNYYGKDSGKAPLKRYEEVRFLVPTTKTVDCYIDNLLAVKTMDAYEPSDRQEGDPVFGGVPINVDSAERDERVYTFDSLSDSFDIALRDGRGSAAVTDGELVLQKANSGVTFPINVQSGTANCTLFEADVNVASSTQTAVNLEVLFRSSIMDKDIARVFLCVKSVGGQKTVTLAEGNTGSVGAEIEGFSAPVGESFKLGFMYFQNEGQLLAFVDGKLVASTDKLCAEANLYRVHAVELNVNSSIVRKSEIHLDNVKVERTVVSLEKATEPDGEEKRYTFDSGIPNGVTVDGSINVAGGKLTMAMARDGDSIIVPTNRRSVSGNGVLISYDVSFGSAPASGAGHLLTLLDADGAAILEYAFIAKDGKISVCESTANRLYDLPIATLNLGNRYIKVEYYPDIELAELTVDGVTVARSSLSYEITPTGNPTDGVKITSVGRTSFTFDNLKAEIYNKLYLGSTMKATNPESGAEKFTFDSSFTGNLPSGIRTQFYSPRAYLSVVESIVGEDASKVLKFFATSGNNDSLYFPITKKQTAFNSIAFEADMNAAIVQGQAFSVYFEVGNNHATRVTFSCTEEGVMKFYQDGGGTSNFSLLVPTDTWFKLRMEYAVTSNDYNGDGVADALLRVYIDGEYVAESYNTYDRSLTPGRINSVMIYSHSALEGSVYFDNVKVEQYNMDLSPIETEEPAPAE